MTLVKTNFIDNHIIRTNYSDSFFHIICSYPSSLIEREGFLFASIQPFTWLCDCIDINQLREVLLRDDLITDTELNSKRRDLCLDLQRKIVSLNSVSLTATPATHDLQTAINALVKNSSGGAKNTRWDQAWCKGLIAGN